MKCYAELKVTACDRAPGTYLSNGTGTASLPIKKGQHCMLVPLYVCVGAAITLRRMALAGWTHVHIRKLRAFTATKASESPAHLFADMHFYHRLQSHLRDLLHSIQGLS